MTVHRMTVLTLALGLALAPVPAIAQMPEHVRAKLDAMGQTFTAETINVTIDLYAVEQRTAPKPTMKVTKDIAYGPDVRHRLDLYQPDGKTGMPVVVYVHGGGYVRGNKDPRPEIYSNVPTYFARHGMLGVNATYRLAPAHKWPAGGQDMGAVVAWLRDNAAKYGGDPGKIFFVASSAGATHVASYVFDKSLQPPTGPGVAGVILLSGFYRPTDKDGGTVKAYFGDDPAQYAARSPLSHVAGSKVPVMLTISEYDPQFLAQPSVELAQALCQRDARCPRLLWLRNHNHISPAVSLNTADDRLGSEIREFILTGR
jgi:acetyl esterase